MEISPKNLDWNKYMWIVILSLCLRYTQLMFRPSLWADQKKNQIDKIFIINLHCSEKGKSLQYQIPQGAPRQMRLLVLWNCACSSSSIKWETWNKCQKCLLKCTESMISWCYTGWWPFSEKFIYRVIPATDSEQGMWGW